ncbi:hypothetical protein [Aestuariibacter sp. GS-14]|uniref:hypothetical protein n=1 Tax=Alteromonadaceae TaxID=72275 RepID=UPI0015E83472|nr:hypothetical protein [Aestuariibacter sp. GS-14]
MKQIKTRIVLVSLAVLLTACSATQVMLPKGTSDTNQIISRAEATPKGVQGEYVLQIKAAASQGQFVYLNTELDYRDQRAVSVSIHPELVAQLTEKYGMSPEAFFLNKTIAVTGKAKRVKIGFSSEGEESGKYFYQTRIRVMDMSQIKVIDDSV